MNKKAKGDEFENSIATMLSFLPNSTVRQQIAIDGKKVDVYCEIDNPLQGKSRIAIECKDHLKPLTRELTASAISDHAPLLLKRSVDKFFLVTRNGVVAHASSCFDGITNVHYTKNDLEDLVLGPKYLLDNMARQFSTDGLDKYYIPAKCFNLDIAAIHKHFQQVYSPLIDLSITKGLGSYRELAGYLENHKKEFQHHQFTLNDNLKNDFKKIIELRSQGKPVDLLNIVSEWIDNDDIDCGLALLGSYGTGKSSFSKFLAHHYAQKYLSGSSDRIPLLIELREFGSQQDIEGLITHHLVNKHKLHNGSYSLFRQMNRMGRYLIIFDGFDEMKQGMTRDALLYNFNEINQLLEGRSKVLLSGRPTIFDSAEEQSLILSSGVGSVISAPGRYIQTEIAPLSFDDTFELLNKYTEAKAGSEMPDVFKRIEELRALIKGPEDARNKSVVDLISRPVHLPMLVGVLPQFSGNITELNRSLLYSQFIKRIIFREVARLPSAYKNRYNIDDRYQFSRDLACAMFSSGEMRAIKHSDIPENLIRPYVRNGETLSATRRDMVAACFLERKPPDNLIFGHKSFLEFLVADQICSDMSNGNLHDARICKDEIPYEVSSFILEMLNDYQMKYLFLGSGIKNKRTIGSLLKSSFKSVGHFIPVKGSGVDGFGANNDGFNSELNAEARKLFEFLLSMNVLTYLKQNKPDNAILNYLSAAMVFYLVSDEVPLKNKSTEAVFYLDNLACDASAQVMTYILHVNGILPFTALKKYPEMYDTLKSGKNEAWERMYEHLTSTLLGEVFFGKAWESES